MNRTSTLAIGAAAALFALAAQATGVRAVDVPRITNGGTGVIVNGSADTPRQRYERPVAGATSSIPTQAGEASTMVGGQPNRQPMTGTLQAQADATRSMGNAGAPAAMAQPSWMHPLWGTPQ